MKTHQQLQADIVGALADLTGDAEPTPEAVVRAKHVALQAQFAAMIADVERIRQEEAERQQAKEHLRMIRARITMAKCVAEHEAEEARKADLAKRMEHDRVNGTPWSGPGFDRMPDGTRFTATQTYLPDRSPTADPTSDAPNVGEWTDRNVYETEPEPDNRTYEDHRRRLLGPNT